MTAPEILALIISAGILGWMFRIERLVSRLATSWDLHFDGDRDHSFASRIKRHSDAIDQNTRAIQNLSTMANIIDQDPELLRGMNAVIGAAQRIAEERIEKRKTRGTQRNE